ncbi:MAG: fused MFS/spermidine synthase [Planctomycetales bacterium]|nr:fused MFS/spermidine synthase [Planctomycetales bacterium]
MSVEAEQCPPRVATRNLIRGCPMAWLYSVTLFLSAALLFTVQPMFGKLVLPRLGGTPSVWNTCMVFFQAALLFGYLYAHASTTKLPGRRQLALHLAVLALPLCCLPLALPDRVWGVDESLPITWLLAAMVVSVGLPFLVLSTTNPTLQVWFAASKSAGSKDPYFLYAASNAGSFLGLFGYPLLIEPTLTLSQQVWWWAIGYGCLALLIGFCALLTWRTQSWTHWSHLVEGPEPASLGQEVHGSEASSSAASDRVTWKQRGQWFGLALIPSSLMLGVTTFLSSDVASFPLLWVIPLGIYLATFILAFAQRLRIKRAVITRWTPLVVLPVVVLQALCGSLTTHWSIYVFNLAAFFLLAMVCHGRLADMRPSSRHLTEFYLWLSVGGVAGGVFNSLIAPFLFVTPLEYAIAITLACVALPAQGTPRTTWGARLMDAVLPLATGGAFLMIGLAMTFRPFPYAFVAALVVPCVAGLTFSRRPARFAMTVFAIVMAGAFLRGVSEDVIFWERGFFGANRVVAELAPERHVLVHGTTIHGWQFQDDRRAEPMTYYHRSGPLGALFNHYRDREELNVAVLGLGCGTTMAYHQGDWRFTFYEIDPMVVKIAEDPRLFTYLSSHQGDYSVVLGDARLKLEEQSDQRFDAMLLDAFSSDVVPVHLLTREAMQVYSRHLNDDGVIAFHVSNRYMDLIPIVGALAHDAGMSAIQMVDDVKSADEAMEKTASIYVFVSPSRATLESLVDDPRARWVEPSAVQPWTDDYTNILKAFRHW